MKVIFLTALHRHLIGADMLGDAAGLARNDVGLAHGVQQRCLAVIDMTHDRDDGGRGTVSCAVSISPSMPSSTSDSATRRTRWPNSEMINSAVSASIDWVIVAMTPMRINDLITSPLRSAMRWASSWTVMASGRDHVAHHFRLLVIA